jgi:hypothetical protein
MRLTLSALVKQFMPDQVEALSVNVEAPPAGNL